MQQIEKDKQKVNTLLENYGPVGPRHLLAAALLMRPREDKQDDRKTDDNKVAA
jgi:hypothetical protein